MTERQTPDTSQNPLLTQINEEILALIRDGKLSALNYPGSIPKDAKQNRKANLKALLAIRKTIRTSQ